MLSDIVTKKDEWCRPSAMYFGLQDNLHYETLLTSHYEAVDLPHTTAVSK